MAFRSGEGVFFCRSGAIVFKPLCLGNLFETASNALLLSSLNEWLLLLVVVPSFKAMEVLLKWATDLERDSKQPKQSSKDHRTTIDRRI